MMRGQNTSISQQKRSPATEQDQQLLKLFNPGAILVGECKLSCGTTATLFGFTPSAYEDSYFMV